MYVIVIHKISDPEKFWSIAQRAVETGGIPEGLTSHGVFPDPTGTRCVCLWEASSVERVSNFLEEALGAFSENDYFEVASQNAAGLPG